MHRIAAAILALLLTVSPALAVAAGSLKLDVLGGKGAKPAALVLSEDGKKVAEVAAGDTIELPPGTYRLVLPLVGGKITKDDVRIEEGRTHTVQIANAAIMRVKAKTADGKDPGFGVTVTTTDPPHTKVAEFITGDSMLFAPGQYDVKVDAPPQGYDWHAVALSPGHGAELTLDEVVPAELTVQPVLNKLAIDKETRVVIYKAGTQRQVAASEAGPEHKFKLDPGDYDAYVENHAGTGKPFVMDHSIHLNSGDKVERDVPLDTDGKP